VTSDLKVVGSNPSVRDYFANLNLPTERLFVLYFNDKLKIIGQQENTIYVFINCSRHDNIYK
ncbi:hypothetical protein THOM_1081, partial [Trachipleistophora hominis]